MRISLPQTSLSSIRIICWAVVAILIIVFTSCETSKSDSSTSRPASTKANGKEVFQTYCKVCHGAKGNLGNSGAFDLTTSELSRAERIQVITYGRNTMTPFGEVLSTSEIQAVADYIVSLRSQVKDE